MTEVRNGAGELLYAAVLTFSCGHVQTVPAAGPLRMAEQVRQQWGRGRQMLQCEPCSVHATLAGRAYGKYRMRVSELREVVSVDLRPAVLHEVTFGAVQS